MYILLGIIIGIIVSILIVLCHFYKFIKIEINKGRWLDNTFSSTSFTQSAQFFEPVSGTDKIKNAKSLGDIIS